MKFSLQIEIASPLEKVMNIFKNPELMFKWRFQLKSLTQIKGNPGEPGSRVKMVLEENGRSIELIEEIVSCNSPYESETITTTDSAISRVKNMFFAKDTNTVWQIEIETRYKGLMRLLAPFLKNVALSRTHSDMQGFKQFVEAMP